ncbi:MAG: CYTH domain-containing protein, partial [Planctomycetota bacterium]|nr:CYTH domain-containing protein [Planctomycetota bacterium]
FAAGWAYRWQDASGRKKLALKSLEKSDQGIQSRTEVEQPVKEFPADSVSLPEGAVAEEVLKATGGAGCILLFQIHKNRRRYFLRGENDLLIEVAVDRTEISTGPSPDRVTKAESFLELELELFEGKRAELERLVEVIESELNLSPSAMSKYERGLRAAGLQPPVRIGHSSEGRIDR